MDIYDTRDVISVEVVQHEKVKVIFSSDDSRETIHAELLHTGCGDDVPCSSLEQTTIHSDSQSYVTFTVVPPATSLPVVITVLWMLVLGLTSLLLIWSIRKWRKRLKTAVEGVVAESEVAQSADRSHLDTNCRKVVPNPLLESGAKVTNLRSYNDPTNDWAPTTNRDTVVINNNNNTSSSGGGDCKMMTTGTSRRPSTPLWPYFLSVALLACCVMLLAMGRGHVSRNEVNDLPVLKISFPADKHIRHIRSYSTDPSLEEVQMGTEASAVLVTRLQLLDLSPDCRNNLSDCRVHALCDSHTGDGSVQCRCNRGFFLKDLQCLPCQTACPEGQYMTQQCGASSDVVCTACTHCGGTTYEVAACTSTQDAICIDVTFPLKQYQSRITTEQELVSLNASMSSNVFLEKLSGIKGFHATYSMTANKQELGFVWVRPESGLTVTVRVTDTYLIPEYVDVEHIDDKVFLEQPRNNFPAKVKAKIEQVRAAHCRHPIPDYYELNMLVGEDKTRRAFEYTCDSQDSRLPACPSGYVDGDKYIYHLPNVNCSRDADPKDDFWATTNSILCTADNQMSEQIFQRSFSKPENIRYQSRDCDQYQRQCRSCLTRNACPGSGEKNGTDCCNKQCHARSYCSLAYSDRCPNMPVECFRGDILKFGIMPRYTSIEDEFTCHLKHRPPVHLYKVSYETSIRAINFNFTSRVKPILYKNYTDLLNGYDDYDFIKMNYITDTRFDDEVILKGTFSNSRSNRVKDYNLNKLKEFHEFTRPPYDVMTSMDIFRTEIQFVRPFLYSTATWAYLDRCDKNLSQIVPNQPMYEGYRRNLQAVEKKREMSGFMYQLLAGDFPGIRFTIPENTSVLSYYRDNFPLSRIIAGTLKGEITWLNKHQLWMINVTGSLTTCPGLFTVEIFVENLQTRIAVYDMFVKCPSSFSTTFILRRNFVNMADIFIVVINDTLTSYQTYLSSVQGPQLFAAMTTSYASRQIEESSPWLPMIIVITILMCASLLLLMIYAYCARKKSEKIVTDIRVPKPDLGPRITLLQNIDKGADKKLSVKAKFIMTSLIILYIAYAFMFTFTILFVLFHIAQGSSIGEITIATNVSTQVQTRMQQSLNAIVAYEEKELNKILKTVEGRLQACSNHMKVSLHQTTPDINAKLADALSQLYRENSGTVQQKLREYFTKHNEVYQKEINVFRKEFNETLESHLHKVQLTYREYLRSVATNKWLEFPLDVFKKQQLLEGRYVENVNEFLPEFLAWLEIDKVQQIVEIKEIVMNRVLTMMPKMDFSRLLNNTDGHGSQQAPINLDLRPPANFFKFSYHKPKPVMFTSYYDTNDYPDDNHGVNKENPLSNIRSIIYPLFIGVFVVLDVCLVLYRISWMFQSIRVFKRGIEERVPYNAITKTIHFILMGRDVPLPEDCWDEPYYMADMWKNKNFWDDRRLYFLYCQAGPKEKMDILREQQKKRQLPNTGNNRKEKTRCYETVLKQFYKVFHSNVFWKLTLLCGFFLVLCLIAKATNDLVTMESAMFLLDTDAMLPMLDRQAGITNRVIEGYRDYLNTFLEVYKASTDVEVENMNKILVNVVEHQSQLLQTVISELCQLTGSSGNHCVHAGVDLTSVTVTACNFLPISVQPFTGFQRREFLESVQSEIRPLVVHLRSILFGTLYLLLIWIALMIVCQLVARVIYIALKKSPHLKRTKIYQLPSQCSDQYWADQARYPEKELYGENHSTVAESCESGVYDLTN